MFDLKKFLVENRERLDEYDRSEDYPSLRQDLAKECNALAEFIDMHGSPAFSDSDRDGFNRTKKAALTAGMRKFKTKIENLKKEYQALMTKHGI